MHNIQAHGFAQPPATLRLPHLWEVLLDHCADVLRVVEVQRSIYLVQDVDGRRLEPAANAQHA
jgi:hypothetical protein